MLRISVFNAPGATELKLEGKLAHEWVEEAARVWSAVTSMNENTRIVVDLMNVSFVDDAGHQLLSAMRHAGAQLIGCGPMMSALIEEIEQAEVELKDEDWDSTEVENRKEVEQ
jgi:anti-anti-sigma regulatory factor